MPRLMNSVATALAICPLCDKSHKDPHCQLCGAHHDNRQNCQIETHSARVFGSIDYPVVVTDETEDYWRSA